MSGGRLESRAGCWLGPRQGKKARWTHRGQRPHCPRAYQPARLKLVLKDTDKIKIQSFN